ncbi:MAG: hypothetical protein IJW54_03475 [Clostridia bacterium]|nr:hypothetical protein [Clostridia bacterium]
MDKFTKTTEIDISAMHDVMEEETPKKNKIGKIVAIIISCLVAIGIWVYASETDNNIETDTYEIQATIDNEVKEFYAYVSGTNSQLADFDASKIVIIKNKDGTGYLAQEIENYTIEIELKK